MRAAPISVLCLHGFCRSGKKAIAREFVHFDKSDLYKIDTPDAPVMLPEEVINELVRKAFRTPNDVGTYWAWFRADDSNPPNYRFLDDSFDMLQKKLPVDGIVGHSQGANVIQMLLSKLMKDGAKVQMFPKFCVFFNMPVTERSRIIMTLNLNGKKIETPVLFLRGKTDFTPLERYVPNFVFFLLIVVISCSVLKNGWKIFLKIMSLENTKEITGLLFSNVAKKTTNFSMNGFQVRIFSFLLFPDNDTYLIEQMAKNPNKL